MTQLKDLYLASSMEELGKLFTTPDLRNKKIEGLISSALNLHKMANKARLDGDEELAYVYYMRYFHLIQFISKMNEYTKKKKRYGQALGGNSTALDAMAMTEHVQKSLNRRYELLAESKSCSEPALEYPSIKTNGNNNRRSIESDDILSGCISCTDFYKLLQNKSASLLVMDCRPREDYEKSSINYNSCLNIPEAYIQVGYSAGKIQESLDIKSRSIWASRSIKDQVIIMDWSSQGPQPKLHTPIWRLRDILQNWDPDVTYRSPIKILKGGYEAFLLMYPTMCSNPNVQAPSSAPEKMDTLEDIEYPYINDILMKDDVMKHNEPIRSGSFFNKPSVDRSSKIAAIKTYEDRNLVDIIKEREKLTADELANDKELLKAENVYKDFIHQEQPAEVENDSKLLEIRQQLMYRILQLENTQKDFKIENELLKKEIEEYRKYGKEIPAVEIQTIKESEEKIEINVQKQVEIEKRLEVEKVEREKNLALARDQKRHMKPPSDEDISKPKIPQFDRSIKPQITTLANDSSYFHHVDFYERDFSAVSGNVGRGLTGLKNLGNTCYMNSILQCLSNTNRLTDYLITNRYKDHLNFNNKTKGRICQEFAALVKVLWSGQYKFVACRDLRNLIGQFNQIFRGTEQQDSHEFLTILMDWMHSDLQTLKIHERGGGSLLAPEKSWLEFTKSKESLILQLFYGQIKSTVKCVECKKESATYDCFSNISLELPANSNVCTLNDCLNMYFSGERIHGWICPNCKQKREAIKKMDISKLPPVLVIHLKRFYADTDYIGNTYRKKLNFVRFPLEGLDMTPYITRSEAFRSSSSKNYDLYSVSNHYGSMESGHYTAFCKSSICNKWFKYDDQVVSNLADSGNVVSSAAYILFFTSLPNVTPHDVL